MCTFFSPPFFLLSALCVGGCVFWDVFFGDLGWDRMGREMVVMVVFFRGRGFDSDRDLWINRVRLVIHRMQQMGDWNSSDMLTITVV